MPSNFSTHLIYFALALVLLFFARFLYSIFHPKLNYHTTLEKDKNSAFAIAIAGYLFGSTLVICGTIDKDLILNEGLLKDSILGFGGIVLLNLSRIILAWISFPKLDLYEEVIKRRNNVAGTILAAQYISVGLILFGALHVNQNSFTGLIGWIIGLFSIASLNYYYDKVLRFNVQEDVEKDNLGGAFAYSGVVISAGILISKSVHTNASLNPSEVLFPALITLLWVLLMVPVFRFILYKIVIKKLNSEFVGQKPSSMLNGILEGMTYIGVSTLLAISFYP